MSRKKTLSALTGELRVDRSPITAETWETLKLVLADEGIPQSWILAMFGVSRPSQLLVCHVQQVYDTLSMLGQAYREGATHGDT